jgi:aminomethyltransferase
MASIIIDHFGPYRFGEALLQNTIDDATVVWQFGDYDLEYAALRTGAGLIDCAAGGPLLVSGPGALHTLQAALARDVEFLIPEHALTSLLLDDTGGVVDIVTVIAGEADFLVLTGAGRAERVRAALLATAGADTMIVNQEPTTGVLAIEGPNSWRAVAAVLGRDYVTLGYQSTLPVEIDGVEVLVARTGVTGEYGYTFVAPIGTAATLWTALASHGAVPVGHRAVETAMFEVRQPIVHREVSAEDSVVTAGLNWLVDLAKEEFVGRTAMVEQWRSGPARRPIGFRVSSGTAQVGDELYVDTEPVGRITYLTTSPGVGAQIGLAKVAPSWQASRLEFSTAAGAQVQTLAPPYVVPRSWTTPISG